MSFKTAIAILFMASLVSGQTPVYNQVPRNEKRGQALLKRLWSPDEAVRQTAKTRLRHLGPRVIPLLLNLLEELKNGHTPHFEYGKEPQGESIYKSYLEAKEDGRDREASAYSFELLEVDITGRLINDTIELLGDLRAESAIPYLIKDIATQPIETKVYWCPSMEALIKIGAPAVPALLELLNVWAGKEPEERPNFTIKRIAIVLGKLGDPRALPTLESIKPSGYRNLDVAPEIEQIRKKIKKPTD